MPWLPQTVMLQAAASLSRSYHDRQMFTLRAYQSKILSEVEGKNAIVVLPTGSGKTAIAGEVIRRRIVSQQACGCGPQQLESGEKFLFLVPTINLVEQQAAFVRGWCADVCGENMVAQYHGDLSLPHSGFKILVSTPKAFLTAQNRHPALLGWDKFCHVTFDEVHHVLKEHPYRKIALSILHWESPKSDGEPPKHLLTRLGLTASLSYAVNDAGIHKSVRELTRELRLETIQTATREELESAGYHGNCAAAEVSGPMCEHQTFRKGNQPIPKADRKPHLLAPTFWNRADKNKCTEFTCALLRCVMKVENIVSKLDQGFTSPLASGCKTRSTMAAWGDYAAKRRRSLSCESLLTAYWVLEQWYEALRIMVVSWEENEEGAVMFLKKMLSKDLLCTSAKHPPAAQDISSSRSATEASVYRRLQHFDEMRAVEKDFLSEYDTEAVYRRFVTLKRALLDKMEDHGRTAFRGILFVEQRVTVHILTHFLRQDPETSTKFCCVELYAATSPATPSLSISKSAAAKSLASFREGTANLLVSTVVAEEGMDVPAANCVLRYDAVLNSVSYAQGRGRARQADSSFVVLQERSDRPASVLHEVEARQLEIASAFVVSRDEAGSAAAELSLELDAQRAREHGARGVLDGFVDDDQSAVAVLNLYVKKTKCSNEEIFKQDADGNWEMQIQYRSCLRAVTGRGAAPDKKSAKRTAARDVLRRLKANEGLFEGLESE